MKGQSLKVHQELYNDYSEYKEESLSRMDFKYSDIVPLINQLKENSLFTVKEIGKSIENREIYQVSYGKGNTNVLLWSQMHGDEPTATMALFDIFNFLKANDHFNHIRKILKERLTIHFIPMLNPDGAEKFQRRNAMSIDINRDALALKSPEAKLLKTIRASINPEFGFNLHDQSTRASVGKSFKQATISLLAPAFDVDRNIDSTREKAMKLIVQIDRMLNNYIPGHIAKYDDEFEPRAFGDNIQKWGTSTVLIESGGWKDDDEKQYIRKLNFVTILYSLFSIAERNFVNEDLAQYSSIPANDKYLYDLLLRNVEISTSDSTFTTDIGINLYETSENGKRFFKGMIDEIGDLSTQYGVREIDCNGMSISYGLTFETKLDPKKGLANEEIYNLLRNGYTTILGDSSEYQDDFLNLPVNIKISRPDSEKKQGEIATESIANLVIRKDKEIRFTIVNGFVFDVKTGKNDIKNTILLR